MRTITKAMLALGFVGAIATTSTVATNAQAIYFSGPGVGVEITTRPYHHRHWRYDRYYGNQPYSYQYYRGYDGRYSSYPALPAELHGAGRRLQTLSRLLKLAAQLTRPPKSVASFSVANPFPSRLRL